MSTNVPLHTTVVHPRTPQLHRAIPTCIRCNLVIAVGDLAVRWPNLITPWGAFVFAPLRDSDPGECVGVDVCVCGCVCVCVYVCVCV